jgi:hypothetical protein
MRTPRIPQNPICDLGLLRLTSPSCQREQPVTDYVIKEEASHYYRVSLRPAHLADLAEPMQACCFFEGRRDGNTARFGVLAGAG